MTSKVIAKSIVQNQAGDVLLLRRSKTDTRRPGEWDFPGGGVEEGEEITLGIAREIREESGLTVPAASVRLVYAATELYATEMESVTRLLFAAKVETDAVQLSFEHDEFKWVDIDTALEEFPHPFYGVGLKYARDNGLLEQTDAR
ncbi:MAG TPA: NUDIX domain-containing protein [Candidatus Saccharimonadales bacterium]|nr:NUDIX domain-containing protein [Candidatus Saccharimonadales bacterium]